jgi:hypothetical protein
MPIKKQIWEEEGADLFTHHFSFPFYSLLLLLFLFFRCFLTRSTILTSSICICLSTSVLCRSSISWPLMLFASYVFTLNKSFILFRSAFIGDLKVSHVWWIISHGVDNLVWGVFLGYLATIVLDLICSE